MVSNRCNMVLNVLIDLTIDRSLSGKEKGPFPCYVEILSDTHTTDDDGCREKQSKIPNAGFQVLQLHHIVPNIICSAVLVF